MLCKNCGHELWSRGVRKRLIRGENGIKIWIKVDQFYCRNCKKWSRVLPRDILPFKQYPESVIIGFREGKLEEDERYLDYPCEETKKRWKT